MNNANPEVTLTREIHVSYSLVSLKLAWKNKEVLLHLSIGQSWRDSSQSNVENVSVRKYSRPLCQSQSRRGDMIGVSPGADVLGGALRDQFRSINRIPVMSLAKCRAASIVTCRKYG